MLYLPLSKSVVDMATHAFKEACLGEFMAAVQVRVRITVRVRLKVRVTVRVTVRVRVKVRVRVRVSARVRGCYRRAVGTVRRCRVFFAFLLNRRVCVCVCVCVPESRLRDLHADVGHQTINPLL